MTGRPSFDEIEGDSRQYGAGQGGGQQPGNGDEPFDPFPTSPNEPAPAPVPKPEAKPDAGGDDDGSWVDWVKGILAAGGVAGLYDWLNKQKSEGDTDDGGGGGGPPPPDKGGWGLGGFGGNLGDFDWEGGGGTGGGDYSWVDQLGDTPGLYGDPKGGAGGWQWQLPPGFGAGGVGQYGGDQMAPPPQGETGGKGKTGGGGTKTPPPSGGVTPPR